MLKMANREGKKRINNFGKELKSDRTDPSEWCLALCCACPPIGLPALIIYYSTKKFKKKNELLEESDREDVVFSKSIRKFILKAREYLGEPLNFDY